MINYNTDAEEIRGQVQIAMNNLCKYMNEVDDMKLYKELHEAGIYLEKARKHLNAALILEGYCNECN